MTKAIGSTSARFVLSSGCISTYLSPYLHNKRSSLETMLLIVVEIDELGVVPPFCLLRFPSPLSPPPQIFPCPTLKPSHFHASKHHVPIFLIKACLHLCMVQQNGRSVRHPQRRYDVCSTLWCICPSWPTQRDICRSELTFKLFQRC